MKNITSYKPKEFAELLNVSVKTLQRWDRNGVLKAKRTPTDRRYYTYDQYLQYYNKYSISFICDSDISLNKLIEMSSKIGGVKIAESIQSGAESYVATKTKD